MSLRGMKLWLAALSLQLIMVATGQAQTPPFFAYTDDLKLFAPPDYSPYGYGPSYQSDGYFGSLEALSWFISNPQRTPVGFGGTTTNFVVPTNNGNTAVIPPAAATPPVFTAGNVLDNVPAPGPGQRAVFTDRGFTMQSNSNDTTWIRSNPQNGIRADFGFINPDTDKGWLFSGFSLYEDTDSTIVSNASVVFDDFTNAAVISQDAGSIAASGAPAGSPITLGLLWGFIDQTSGGAIANRYTPDGIDDDLNRNNLYGRYGRDRGAATGGTGTITAGTPLDGIPDREGGTNVDPAPVPGNTSFGTTQTAAYYEIDWGDAVPLPVIFDEFQMRNSTKLYGAEANRLWRFDQGPQGGSWGNWEAFVGTRFVNFSDTFFAYGVGGILADSFWNNQADNRLVGPQLGFRYKFQRNRWSLVGEARGIAAANFQSIHMNGEIGSRLTQVQPWSPQTTFANPTQAQAQQTNPGGGPNAARSNQPLFMYRSQFTRTNNDVEFSPMAEFKAKYQYQVFRDLSLSLGYTGMWMDNMARAQNTISYVLPAFELVNTAATRQMLWTSGVNFGIELKR